MATAPTAHSGPPIATIQARTSMHAARARSDVEQHEPPVEAVGDDAGRDRQQDVRQQARGPDDAEDDRVLRLLVDEHDQRDEVQPVADRRHELADEQPGQRPVAQQLAVRARDRHPAPRAVGARFVRGGYPARRTRVGPSPPRATTRSQTITADSVASEGDALYCYRHPDREIYVRCGRCDRPICTGCAMLGPVGMRCKDCGKPAYDPLTSFTPRQLVLGLGVALVGGIVAAFIASRIGFFSIIVSFFAGGLVAQAVVRVTGYKQGPRMLALVFGGIVGRRLGRVRARRAADVRRPDRDHRGGRGRGRRGRRWPEPDRGRSSGRWRRGRLVSAGATCAGAWSRLR